MGKLVDIPSLVDSDPDTVFKACTEALRYDPEDAQCLFLIALLFARSEEFGQAIPLLEKVTRLKPHKAGAWNNLGMCLQECGQFKRAQAAFKQAIALAASADYYANLGAAYNAEGNYSEGKRWCRKALEIDPEHQSARATMGFCDLATGNWSDGWKGYDAALGGRFRKEVKIGLEPRWNGEYVDSLFVYGEQGIGDEIMYASCLEDLRGRVGHVVLECDARLGGLFARSFPWVEVHATRRGDQSWAKGRRFDAGCGAGALPRLFRPSPQSCPRVPYLVPDPERRLQWRSLFASFGKPVIGLAWTGGRANTCKKERAVGLEAFRSYIERKDAVFVSLQYTDAHEEIAATGLPVRVFDRAMRSPDFDDTAAFVAELDGIVGIHTTVHHLAGAMGKSSVALVPSRPMWNYASGDGYAWYADNKYHRQKPGESWEDCIRRLP